MLSEPITQMRGSSELLAAMVGDIAVSGWGGIGSRQMACFVPSQSGHLACVDVV